MIIILNDGIPSILIIILSFRFESLILIYSADLQKSRCFHPNWPFGKMNVSIATIYLINIDGSSPDIVHTNLSLYNANKNVVNV